MVRGYPGRGGRWVSTERGVVRSARVVEREKWREGRGREGQGGPSSAQMKAYVRGPAGATLASTASAAAAEPVSCGRRFVEVMGEDEPEW